MYADRHAPRSGLDRKSAGIALALNAAALAGLLLAKPELIHRPPKPPLTTYPVPLDPTPPVDPAPTPEHALARHVTTTPPVSPPPPVTVDLGPAIGDVSIPPIGMLDAGPAGPAALPTATPEPPALVAAIVDPRYARDLQPAYPASELRAEREGVAVVRVLIGTDGRVRRVERVSASGEPFFRATEAQALSRWRFRPATRGGVAVETWTIMTIRFVIPA